MDKKELLNKVYDKYQMEINRKDRLESKAIGYYTILGIFLAGFLVVEPLLLNNSKLLFIPTFKELLSVINYLLVIVFIVIFIVSVLSLHNCYKPKKRPEFDPIVNWEKIINTDDSNSDDMVKNELIKNISYSEEANNSIVKKLVKVNLYCIMSVIIVVLIFALLVISYYL